jgi:excisionase family DNA binding protein
MDALLTLNDIARMLGVSRSTAGSYVREGRLEAIRLGHADTSPLRFRRSAFDAFLAEGGRRQAQRVATP